MRAVAAFVLFLLSLGVPFLGASAARADDLRTPSPAAKATCDCSRFESALAEARAIFASREEGIAMPLTPVMHNHYRARVDAAYGRADCLAACENVPEPARNRARVLLAEAGFKNASIGAAEWRARLTAVLAAMARCLEVEPEHRACQLWHASSRGLLARGSWNPLNLRLPSQLMSEFRSARGGAAPGCDHGDGPATRGEASMLLKVPRFAGGDPSAGRALIEAARTAPRYGCRLANRLVLAEALGRTGDLAAARNELQSIVDSGLPDCGHERYENAMSLEEAARCLARLDAVPDADPGWDEDCRRP
jgi:hypothetical protein